MDQDRANAGEIYPQRRLIGSAVARSSKQAWDSTRNVQRLSARAIETNVNVRLIGCSFGPRKALHESVAPEGEDEPALL
jgi:hypothetical protein